MSNNKSEVISNIISMLLEDNEDGAKMIISQEYPHTYFELKKHIYYGSKDESVYNLASEVIY